MVGMTSGNRIPIVPNAWKQRHAQQDESSILLNRLWFSMVVYMYCYTALEKKWTMPKSNSTQSTIQADFKQCASPRSASALSIKRA